ncbi:MAG: prepilin-type N-terminal cleavage/methylation domain-containing protein [Patescibacteria group bacterium]
MSKHFKKGFTIIEAMIAIAVLTIGILAVVKIFPVALQISKSAEQATVAINLAQAKTEELFSLGYDNIGIGTIEAKTRLSSDPDNPFYPYQRETTAGYVDEDLQNSVSDTGMKKITVTVFWRHPLLLGEKHVDLETLISQQ